MNDTEVGLSSAQVRVLDDDFLSRSRSLQEISAFLDVSDGFLRVEILKGRLVARKLSNQLIRVLPGDLRNWLDRCVTRPRKPGLARGRKAVEV